MKHLLSIPAFALAFGLVGVSNPALAHSDDGGDSITVTITIDGEEHDVRIDEDGVEIDGKPLEDMDIDIVIEGDVSEVADEILDEIEEALREVEEAIDDVREEHDIDD